jgi:hypothetical protein
MALIAAARKMTMSLRIPYLDVQEHQVDLLELCIAEAITEKASSIQGGMAFFAHASRGSEARSRLLVWRDVISQ